MAEDTNDKRRFFDSLPFYTNGTISQDDRRWVDNYLREHPEAQKHLRLSALIHSALAAEHSAAAEEQRLERVRAAWLKSRNGLLRRTLRIPAFVIGVVAALEIAQLFYIGAATMGVATIATRGIQQDCSMVAQVKVVFKPDTPWVDALLVIRQSGATLRAGPSETGEVWLAAPKGTSAEVVQSALSANPSVEQAIAMDPTLPEGCKK